MLFTYPYRGDYERRDLPALERDAMAALEIANHQAPGAFCPVHQKKRGMILDDALLQMKLEMVRIDEATDFRTWRDA